MNNLPAVAWKAGLFLCSQHLCGHYLMLEEFVTLAELSDVRKTNFRVNLMSMAVKNIFLVLTDPRHASGEPQWPEPCSVPRCLGQEVYRKLRVLLSAAGEAVCLFPRVALLFTGP